ncbi:MAG TPA: hypothetical protein VJR70_09970, partial [Stellaceae bacterium]|nr:hypothetical protein [Stellaceae bacterium]
MTYAINSTTAGIALGLATQNPAEVLPGAYVTNKTASLGGDAIYGSSAAAWTITNYGTVRTTTGTGIDLRSGGSITNAAAGSIT